MRLVLPVCALALSAAATAAPQQSDPGPTLFKDQTPVPAGTVCRGKIEAVREERRLPKLDPDSATGEPLFIAAVDRIVDGCEVLVMRNNTADIRPLPDLGDRPVRLQRLR